MEGKDTAVRVWIAELLQGKIKQIPEGPSYLIFNGNELKRVCFCGIVVSSDLFIDDGTGSVLVRVFEKKLRIDVGDCVLVVGRPRIYDNEIYILGEILKKIDSAWLAFWKKKYPFKAADLSIRVLDIVRKKDKGEGADYDSVIGELGDKGEELIVHLLATGELFETRPGKLKVLD